MGEISKSKSPLLPNRLAQGDFFVCDIFDAAPKGDMASMEHPIFSLSTKPDRHIRRYEHAGKWLEITPSVKGLATIHDRDLLIYCISQAMAALNDGHEVSQTMRLKAHDFLKATNRMSNGQAYEGMKTALERLRGTTIVTNVTTGDTEELDGFGLIERFRIVRESRDGRMQEVEVKLSDWVFNAIRHREVLTLHRDYFRLRKPLERRIYELARKHCGHKDEWSISLELLQKKCGSSSTLREFRRLTGHIIEQDRAHHHIPDYSVTLEDRDMVVFRNRKTMPPPCPALEYTKDMLDPDTYEEARQSAPGWDVRYLEKEWQSWMEQGGQESPRSPDKAFLGFCRAWYARRGQPA